jgi:hypothetical protein
LLDAIPPPFSIAPRVGGGSHQSTTANQLYATIGLLEPWPLPRDYCGYLNLPQNIALPPPPSIDPTLNAFSEADIVWGMRLYYFNPVGQVLFYTSAYRVTCRAEYARSVAAEDLQTTHSSRMDLVYLMNIPGVAAPVPFAVVEVKRKDAIKFNDWVPALKKWGALGEGAEVMCRQAVKYCYCLNVAYFAFFDGRTTVLGKVCGNRAAWRSARPMGAPPCKALYRWLDDPAEMKRNLFIWLKQAQADCLSKHGIIV